MVKPVATPDLTVTLSSEMLARAEAADDYVDRALDAVLESRTPQSCRDLARARHELADAYLALAKDFCDLPSLHAALYHRVLDLRALAAEDDLRAEDLEERTGRGEAA